MSWKLSSSNDSGKIAAKQDIDSIVDFETNVYFKSSPKEFMELLNVVKSSPCVYARVLACTRKDLLAWVESCLPLLKGDAWSTATKASWILHGRTAFPRCEVCGSSGKYSSKSLCATTDYAKTCCPSCSKKHPDTIAKTKATNLRTRGTEYTFQSEEVKAKIYSTLVQKNCRRTKEAVQEERERRLASRKDIKLSKLEIAGIESNIYCKDSPEFFLELKTLVEEQPFSYSYSLSTAHRDLLAWINAKLPLLQDASYHISTKVHWILHGMANFPTCPVCGKKDNYKGKNVSAIVGYKRHCSDSCAQSDKDIQKAIRATCKEKYGVEFPQQLPETKQKAADTCMERYGVPNASQDPMLKAKIASTNMQKRGVPCPFQSPEVQAKIAATNEKNLGVANPFSSKQIQAKIHETTVKKYGVDNPSQADCVKAKKAATTTKHFGVSSPMHSHDIRVKVMQKYEYDGKKFDSQPEIAYYIWLSDNGIKFEYQPDAGIKYVFEGKTHLYCPDFKVDGQLVEIKGSQFLKEDGTWHCPYDHSKDGQTEAKRQCLISNNVKIMYEDEYMKYVKYVEEKYGKNFLQTCKSEKSSDVQFD